MVSCRSHVTKSSLNGSAGSLMLNSFTSIPFDLMTSRQLRLCLSAILVHFFDLLVDFFLIFLYIQLGDFDIRMAHILLKSDNIFARIVELCCCSLSEVMSLDVLIDFGLEEFPDSLHPLINRVFTFSWREHDFAVLFLLFGLKCFHSLDCFFRDHNISR